MLITANVPAVTKNVVAIDSSVYTTKMSDKVSPFRMEYTIKITVPMLAVILLMRLTSMPTATNSRMINPKNIHRLEKIKFSKAGEEAVYIATKPVMTRARHIQP